MWVDCYFLRYSLFRCGNYFGIKTAVLGAKVWVAPLRVKVTLPVPRRLRLAAT